jgi:hypothetical protein
MIVGRALPQKGKIGANGLFGKAFLKGQWNSFQNNIMTKIKL